MTPSKKNERKKKEKKKNMRKNKIGAVFLVSALALAGIGITYAGFTDTISVYGTVSTATVELDIEAYSGTDVYKVWGTGAPTDETYIFRGYSFERKTLVDVQAMYPNAQVELISSAWSHDYEGPGDFDFAMTFDNLFPCIDFTADFILHYEGSIPVKVNIAQWIMYTDWLEELYLAGGVSIKAFRCTVPNPDQPIGPDNYPTKTEQVVDLGTQLHFCDYVIVELTLHLPQNNYWQGKTGEFSGKVGVIQWNDMCDDQQPGGQDFLKTLSLHVLDGIADDSFKVYVDDILVYTYVDHDPENDPEMWRTHIIDLTPYEIPYDSIINTVKIDATGPKWSGFNTYGQLAVNTITLSGDTVSDTIDIGDTASEAGHNLLSWGPIEPATSGGYYGGIDNCRVTWDVSTDSTWATVDFNL